MIWLRKLAKACGALPISFILDGVEKEGSHPICGGSYAVRITCAFVIFQALTSGQDIWKGRHEGDQVCLKVLRIFTSSDRAAEERTRKVREAISYKKISYEQLGVLLRGRYVEAVQSSKPACIPWSQFALVLPNILSHIALDGLWKRHKLCAIQTAF
jgi:hypothetical protein